MEGYKQVFKILNINTKSIYCIPFENEQEAITFVEIFNLYNGIILSYIGISD